MAMVCGFTWLIRRRSNLPVATCFTLTQYSTVEPNTITIANTGGGSSPMLCSQYFTSTHASSGDRYISMVGTQGDTGSAANAKILLPGTGTFTKMTVYHPTAPGGTVTLTYTLFVNDTATNISCAIGPSVTTGCTGTGSASWTDGQTAYIKVNGSTSGAASSPEGICTR